MPDGPLGDVQGFVQQVFWYWQGPEDLNCEDIGDTHCEDVVECDQADTPSSVMASTAFANIHMASSAPFFQWGVALKGKKKPRSKTNTR